MLDRVLCSSRCLCFVCDPMFFMCSFQISVLLVLMRVDISLFNSGILGSCGLFLLVKFLCAMHLLRMGCGRSLSVLRILPTGMCFLPAW